MARRGSNNYFNLANVNNAPKWSTVLPVILQQLDQVSQSLQNARELGGPESGIPTWETLMAAWEAYQAAGTDDVPVDGAEAPGVPRDEEALKEWARGATVAQLRGHPVIRVALIRGVLKVPMVGPWDGLWPFNIAAALRDEFMENDMHAWEIDLPAVRPPLDGQSDSEDDPVPETRQAVVYNPDRRSVPEGMAAPAWDNYVLND